MDHSEVSRSFLLLVRSPKAAVRRLEIKPFLDRARCIGKAFAEHPVLVSFRAWRQALGDRLLTLLSRMEHLGANGRDFLLVRHSIFSTLLTNAQCAEGLLGRVPQEETRTK